MALDKPILVFDQKSFEFLIQYLGWVNLYWCYTVWYYIVLLNILTKYFSKILFMIKEFLKCGAFWSWTCMNHSVLHFYGSYDYLFAEYNWGGKHRYNQSMFKIRNNLWYDYISSLFQKNSVFLKMLMSHHRLILAEPKNVS